MLVDAGNRVLVIDDLSVGSRSNLARHLEREPIGLRRINGADGDEVGAIGVAPTAELVEASITDRRAMHDLIVDADLVVHMAVACVRTSLNDPEFVHHVNATGTLNVCLAAQRNRVGRLVYVSSSEAYGSAVRVPMDEDHPTQPTTVYGASKLVGEAYALAIGRTYGTEVTVVRPFNSYGPREPHLGRRAEVIPKFVLRTMAGARPVIFGSGLQTRDFTWVEDTARGIAAACAADELVGSAVNIARGQEVSIRQLAEKVLTIFGRGGELPIFDRPRPGDVDRHFADTTRARRVLRWQATLSIDEGLRRYIDWLADQDIDLGQWLAEDERRNW